MKPTREWCRAAVARLGNGAVMAGGGSPDLAQTYVVTPVRMGSPIETGALGTQIVTSQVDVVCFTLQRQEAQIVNATEEVWTRCEAQVERVHQLGALGVAGIIYAAPIGCDFQVADAGEPWYIAATVAIELSYMRSLVAGA